jgi:hypothetical protein
MSHPPAGRLDAARTVGPITRPGVHRASGHARSQGKEFHVDPVLGNFDDDDDFFERYPEASKYLTEDTNESYPGASKYLTEDTNEPYPDEYLLAQAPPRFLQVELPHQPARYHRPDRVQLRSEYGSEGRYVKYLTTLMQRLKYRVTVGNRLKRRSMLLDTRSIKQHFKSKDRSYGTGRASLGMAPLIKSAGRDEVQEWMDGSLIWVCADGPSGQPDFYTHVGKINRFHHSTFFAGADLIGAGEWIVEDGRLKKISANSGHYQPSIDFLYTSVLHLKEAWQDDTVVLVWETTSDSWQEVPVRRFAAEPGGGRWKSHPDSG